MNLNKFQTWASNKLEKAPKVRLKPGQIITFAHSIKGDDNELDFMPLFLLVEAKIQYFYGVNLFRIPARDMKDVLELLSDNTIDNLKLAAEIHKNPILRKAYKYYRMKDIHSRVLIVDKDDFNRFS